MVNILIIKQYVIIGVFPVCTGINRVLFHNNDTGECVPCMHRDKPSDKIFIYVLFFVFPVCTGINRQQNPVPRENVGVPCMHRDKPAGNLTFL